MLIQYAAGVEDGAAMGLLPGLADGAWVPHVLAGISETSGQKELAADFLEAMLSHEVQDYCVGDGLPALQAGLNAQFDRLSGRDSEPAYGMGRLDKTDFEALLAG